MIERLLARVLWDDASTPVTVLWLTAQGLVAQTTGQADLDPEPQMDLFA